MRNGKQVAENIGTDAPEMQTTDSWLGVYTFIIYLWFI
jgi:hypothetical protein